MCNLTKTIIIIITEVSFATKTFNLWYMKEMVATD